MQELLKNSNLSADKRHTKISWNKGIYFNVPAKTTDLKNALAKVKASSH